MTKPTQETLREAVARAICEANLLDPDKPQENVEWEPQPMWMAFIPDANAAIATMFERLRDLPPSIYDGPDQYVRKADVLAAFQQENSDA